MTDAQARRFDVRFASLRAAAFTLPDVVGEVVTTSSFGPVRGDQFPEATATRQMLAVTPLYLAGVASLALPETSLAALALMRPLIETWMHLYFIMGEDEMADAACRAIRLEAGWAQNTLAVVRASGLERASDLDIAKRRVREIEAERSRRGCRGGVRDYGDVEQTVKTMADRHKIDWLLGAWRSSSQMVHAAGWDWALTRSGDGSLVAVDPAPSQRAARLNHLVVLFYNVTQTYLVVTGVLLDSDPARRVWTAARQVLDDPWLIRMIEGDFD